MTLAVGGMLSKLTHSENEDIWAGLLDIIDSFHIVISLSNRSSFEKSIKPFLKMKGQIAY